MGVLVTDAPEVFTQAMVRALGHLLEQYPITILLRTPHTPAAGHRLMSNREAASCWLPFILRQFAMQENKFLLLPNTGHFMLNPACRVRCAYRCNRGTALIRSSTAFTLDEACSTGGDFLSGTVLLSIAHGWEKSRP